MRLGLIILAVEELPRALAFYRAVLGWDQPVDTPVYAELVSPAGMRLGLYTRQNFGRNFGLVPEPIVGPVATTEIYFYTEELDAVLARAAASGATLLDPARDRAWGDHVAYVSDPDGYVIAFAPEPRVASRAG